MEQFIYPIYKPKGPTSHDIVDKIRKITDIRKVGHAGTLDPLASGVLVIGITREGTKQMPHLVKKEKEYIALVKLGETSTTDDEEGDKQTSQTNRQPELSDIQEVVKKFIGNISQVTPIYSAIKIKGKAAYKMARKGEVVEMKPREVEIKDIEILNYEWPVLKIRVETGSGVYIRSLARDIGEELGIGGYLADLERTRVGEFTKEESLSIEDFQIQWKKVNKIL